MDLIQLFMMKFFREKVFREFCKSTGLALREEYKLIPLQILELLVARPLHFISLGLLSYDHAGLLYIIEKQQV